MPDSNHSDQFHELLGRFLEDGLSESEHLELTELVRRYPTFSKELQSQLMMDSRLAQYDNERHSADTFSESVEAALNAEQDGERFVEQVVDAVSPPRSDARKRRRLQRLALLAALGLCLLAAVFVINKPQPAVNVFDEDVPHSLAIIENRVGGVSFDGEPRVVGDSLEAGVVIIDAYAALEFYKGARVIVAGPAKLELVHAQRLICHYGKIRATVPAVATGFTVVTPASEVVDLGTEFAMEVGQDGQTQVHVFDGEVEAFNAARDPQSLKLLTAGDAAKMTAANTWEAIPAERERFADLQSINQRSRDQEGQMFAAWQAMSSTVKADPRLIAYYDVEKDPQQRRTLVNRAPNGAIHDGAIVGARWTTGPWGGKSALAFQRPGDRVRLNLKGTYQDITLAAWVRVDGLDRSYSSLLLTDGFGPGAIHWQFLNNGSLLAGLNFSRSGKRNFRHDGFMDLNRLGRWVHVTTVIDQTNGKVSSYLNGELFGEHKSRSQGEWVFGDASIGNWDNPTETPAKVRNLNGAIAELMVFNAALSPDEIKTLSLNESN